MGHAGAARRARRGAGAAPALRGAGLRRDLDEHLGAAERGAPGRSAAVGHDRPGALDGRRAPGRAPGASSDRRGRPRGRVRGRVQPQRGPRPRRRRDDDPAAVAGVRGRAAGPPAAGDALARARLHVRHGRAAAGDRDPAVVELPPLPPRRVRRVRPALGRARGRRVRPRRGALRDARDRRAADQLPAARPRAGDARLAARLHRPAARRLPEPRLPVRRRLALGLARSAGTSTPSWPWAGGPRARRSSAAAAASAPAHIAAARDALADTPPGRERPAPPPGLARPAARAGRWTDGGRARPVPARRSRT